ncbi:MAG: NADP-dependent methylenetetrahydromethanopterin/methylenetetrahydrofolate dehydrogenase [Chloroflexota bacterium]|nr:NADP-dependent methylenetetrahydromethanopterin/methylenetetrahydrofolate dehydrogenase [Chloroflexota bacterium]
MKKLLLQLDSDKHPSVFDTITAYDAGADHVMALGNVAVEDVRDLVYGAMFTRGGDALKNSAVFIGGSDVPTGEAMLKAATEAFFGPVRVSVMMDSNGCNTTAASAVAKILGAAEVKGKKAVVLAGTGPVGMRAAAFLSKEGCQTFLTSRRLERAQKATSQIKERFGVEVTPLAVSDEALVRQALEGVAVVLTAGRAGVQLVSAATWTEHPTLEVLGDVNAVPPLGIEGIKPHWDGKEKHGKVIFGALGIGGLKMKVHRACVARLFESSELVLDGEQIFVVAREMGG